MRSLLLSVAKTQRQALKGARIHLRLEVEDFRIYADYDKLRTVFDNLLSNAGKFTPKAGTITIRGNRTTSSFIVEFADTGPGIPEDESPRIFDAFFQGKRKQGGHIAGTGIGLSVVHECVHAHNGTVQLVDSHEFPGAHFLIEIPQSRETPQARMAASA
jgi:two-component system sensor histidine kinase GlrK